MVGPGGRGNHANNGRSGNSPGLDIGGYLTAPMTSFGGSDAASGSTLFRFKKSRGPYQRSFRPPFYGLLPPGYANPTSTPWTSPWV